MARALERQEGAGRTRREVMGRPDVLIVTALQMEFDAMIKAIGPLGLTPSEDLPLQEMDEGKPAPYFRGNYTLSNGSCISLAFASAERMGGTPVLALATELIVKLKPRCLAMCGVCAGNPDDVALGDVVVAEMTYQYDEGKREAVRFLGDHRQSPLTKPAWLRRLQKLKPEGLPSHGVPTEEDSNLWFLERVGAQRRAKDHPARKRYIPDASWSDRIQALEASDLIRREDSDFKLTNKGQDRVAESLAHGTAPTLLPFDIKVGPMASGNAVVKDEVTWDSLKEKGVRTVIGLEMEAAAIGYLGRRNTLDWVVAKGVMDHADPKKDDRYKSFAARASAEVLFRFLISEYAKPPKAPRARKSSDVRFATGNDAKKARAYIALIEAIFDGDYFLPGGGLKVIRLIHASELISDPLMLKIKSKVKYSATLDELAASLVQLGLIKEALSELAAKISDDWDGQLSPYAKLSILQLNRRFPEMGLDDLPPLTDEEREVISIKWAVSDALFQVERDSWFEEMSAKGLDLENMQILWTASKEAFDDYVAAFARLIHDRIAIDLALVTASTQQPMKNLVGYVRRRARRSSEQVTRITDELCSQHPNKAVVYRMLSEPMKDASHRVIKNLLEITPSLDQMNQVKNAL
jgi:nucleoside phosphorylase